MFALTASGWHGIFMLCAAESHEPFPSRSLIRFWPYLPVSGFAIQSCNSAERCPQGEGGPAGDTSLLSPCTSLSTRGLLPSNPALQAGYCRPILTQQTRRAKGNRVQPAETTATCAWDVGDWGPKLPSGRYPFISLEIRTCHGKQIIYSRRTAAMKLLLKTVATCVNSAMSCVSFLTERH